MASHGILVFVATALIWVALTRRCKHSRWIKMQQMLKVNWQLILFATVAAARC